ncbi:hypothetical protein [Cohnella algarum]|uniref:hypothetical protein n=1 Tax=Cohnella algarum TaxID=2044859 RepID=UPI001967EDD9|nr:hypothetical protein [Cohnella algarum]MBN2981337.1 hypothetical protein [Cohnella algarum]
MNGIERFRDEIERVFEEASRELAELPAELRELGRALLLRSHPLRNGGGTNAISFLLPYWLQEEAGAPTELCHHLAVGNLYAMLHFFILDDAMDGGTGRFPSGKRKSMALGQMLHVYFRRRYGRYFPLDSPLWTYERDYMEQWASAMNREGSSPADPRDFRQLAGKAAPVKLCAAGLLIGAGQEERIADMETAVDLALAVLQLSDDWTDWREDLDEPNRNAFLTLVREVLAGAAEGPLDERLVKRAIYRRRCLGRLADIAAGYGDRLRRIEGVPIHLAEFQLAVEQGLREEARKIDETVDELASGGGLTQILSNSINK